MKRSDLTVSAGWLALALTNLWFASQGFTTHGLHQVALEVVGLGLVGVCIARFAPEGWGRSTLWPAVFSWGLTAILLGPRGLSGLVFLVGVVTLAFGAVIRLERARTWGLWAGLAAGILGGVGTRAMVLVKASGGTHDGRQTSVARNPWVVLAEEALAPFQARPAAPTADGPPVVLITVDTLRADRMVRMEAFQRLAARGPAFPRVLSTSSWTVPSMASVMTGVVPEDHGAGVSADGRFQGLSAEVPTLSTALDDAGYLTAGFATNAWLTAGLGFDRGFDVYWHADERFHHRLVLAGFPEGPKAHEAEAVVDRALAWLDRAPDRGVFLWVHLLDPHLPYLHAEGALEQGLTDERLRAGMRLTAETEARVIDAYDREVAYTDHHLGRLLDALQARGWLDEGVVALTADHGEEFWDHGATGHGHQHHPEVVDVGAVLSWPGATPGPRVDPASLADVPSTLAARAGLPPLGDGVDLAEPQPDTRIVVSQGNAYFRQQQAAQGLGLKAIVTHGDDRAPVCFDHTTDRTEQRPQACPEGHPVLTAARSARPPAPGEDVALPREALEALGYLVDEE